MVTWVYLVETFEIFIIFYYYKTRLCLHKPSLDISFKYYSTTVNSLSDKNVEKT